MRWIRAHRNAILGGAIGLLCSLLYTAIHDSSVYKEKEVISEEAKDAQLYWETWTKCV